MPPRSETDAAEYRCEHAAAGPMASAGATTAQAGVTLGLEDELQVVDAASGALIAHDVGHTKRMLSQGPGGVAREIHQCTLELQTPICGHPDAIVASLAAMRALAREQAGKQGQQLISAGLHPFSSWQDQALHDDADRFPHYAHLLDEYGEIARSAMSFGMHVHLGVPDARHRMAVMNALRSVLPDVLALSANAPFYEGRDTGLASWRHSVLGRYPRMGIPDVWSDEESYFGHIDRLRRLGSLEADQGMWDDLRLHHRYRTLEVRICDAVHSLDRIWLIVALLQCEVATLCDEAARGQLSEPEPRVWIEENKWRARRHGLNADFIDWRRSESLPLRTRFERWLERLLPAAMKLDLWPRLELALVAAFSEGTGADQQRRWLAAGGSFENLVKALADATAEPWSAPTPIRQTVRELSNSPEAENVAGRSWAA